MNFALDIDYFKSMIPGDLLMLDLLATSSEGCPWGVFDLSTPYIALRFSQIVKTLFF